MKFLKINFFIVFVAFLLCLTFVNSQEEGNKRNLLLRRPGGRPGGPLSKQTSTTTAAPALPEEAEEERNEDEYDQEGEEADKANDDSAASTSTTTTTEPPKKIGPIVRPFRSNEDLLNALKRRQQSIKKNAKAIEKVTPKPQQQQEDDEKDDEPAAAPAKPADRASGARRNKFSNDHSQAKRPGRLSLRSTK